MRKGGKIKRACIMADQIFIEKNWKLSTNSFEIYTKHELLQSFESQLLITISKETELFKTCPIGHSIFIEIFIHYIRLFSQITNGYDFVSFKIHKTCHPWGFLRYIGKIIIDEVVTISVRSWKSETRFIVQNAI